MVQTTVEASRIMVNLARTYFFGIQTPVKQVLQGVCKLVFNRQYIVQI